MNRRTVQVTIARHSNGEVLSTETVPKYRDKNWARIAKSEAVMQWRRRTGDHQTSVDVTIVDVAE